MKRAVVLFLVFCGLLFAFSSQQPLPVKASSTIWPAGSISTPITWTAANSPYIVTGGRITILSGGSLTIGPGVEVDFPENSGGILVDSGGKLIAQGSSGSLIHFTATDTTKPWDSIIVYDTGTLQLNYCDIAYAKGTYSGGNGILYLYSSDVQVTNTRIHNNTGHAMMIAYAGLTPLFQNVTIDQNTGVAIFQSFITAQPVYQNIVMNGNAGGDYVYINTANVDTQDVTMDGTGLNGSFFLMGTNFNVYKTLTIQPGTELRFLPNGGLFVQNGGKFIAQGTSTNRIRFTALDTAQLWNAIVVYENASASLNYCDISYAKSNYSSGNGVLYLYSSDVQVKNTRIHHNNSIGININSAELNPLFQNVTIDYNSGYAIHQNFMTSQPVYQNIVMNQNTGGDFLYINTGNVDTKDVILDGTGLNGKPILVGTNFAIYHTLTIMPGTQIQLFQNGGIWVETGGKLVAEGTAAKPIIFTAVDTTKPWNVIMVDTGASARLAYCDISHASSGYSSGKGVLYLYTSDVEVRNCRIHDNPSYAMTVTYNSHPLLRDNLFDHDTYGLMNLNDSVWVDARFNYWGDPTGPLNTKLNPSGLGLEVSDKVVFAPWFEDTQGTLTQKVLIQVVGPTRAAPGEKLEYQIFYYAGQALSDAVLTFTLPDAANFISTTPDGAYYPSTSQVYWKLGNLATAAEGTRSVVVQAMWGLPNQYPDAVGALFGSPTLQIYPYSIDTSAYKNYSPVTATGSTVLTSGQIDAAFQASPDLKALYTSATAHGYIRLGGSVISTSDGKKTTQIVLMNAATKATITLRLDQSSGAALAVTFTATTYTMTDKNGSVTLDLAQNQVVPSGDWNLQPVGPSDAEHPLVNTLAEISPYVCWRNCMLQAAGMWAISKLNNTIDMLSKTKDCAMALTGDPDSAANCFLAIEKVAKLVPGISEIKETTKCTAECANPLKRSNYVCSGALTSVEPPTWAWANPASWTESGRKRQYVRYTCNPTTQMWTAPEILYCPAGFIAQAGALDSSGKPCVPANDDVAFAYGYPDRKVPSTRSSLTLRSAKDPNAKYGVNNSTQSAILANQLLTYTITYENEGEGNAYGVYILDSLNPNLDEATLNLGGKGQYYPASRQIAWDIGDLAPKGQTGSSGSVSFTIKPRTGLKAGTVITNQALVYFPSVPEETPTNVVINTIQPVVAIPQEVQATGGQAKAITLHGSGPGTLTYQVVDPPMHGTISGTPPALSYTSDPGFNGQDIFSFQAKSSTATSLEAQVFINVNPNPSDATPPTILWSSPSDGVNITSPTPATFTDDKGVGYFPLVILQVSEALDPATVNATNITITAGGKPITASVDFMDGLNRIVIVPRQALPTGSQITVTISTAVKDIKGNPLAAKYTIHFMLVAADSGYKIFLPLAASH